ncbi:unnamed protein product [Mytilus coruscus]|uniref:Uncharacterized protein n=1 Tax=Mytilus coruscus TaxID=42192 RepID=A0A6J8EML8_MYTCO|nr:unnamed protein product [Mytilus coruscus]
METKLKAIRAGNRAAVTKLWIKFEELRENTDNVEVEEVKAIEDAVTQKKKILHDLNEKMIEVLHEDHIEDIQTRMNLKEKSTMNANAECYIPISNTSNTNTSAIYSLNTRERLPSEENPTGNQSRNFPGQNLQTYNNQEECSYIQPQAQPPNIFSNNHRLPKLDLPHFDWDVLQWSTFWDSYESIIHYNSSLTPIQKFSYLKAQLIGSAAQTIAGFALTNANYETAVCMLRKRFGHPQKIIKAYIETTDVVESSTAENEIDYQQGIHQITRYSTLSKLLRITAYVFRFIRNCRSPILQRNKAKYVSREELQDATECWILNCQRTSFKDEMLNLKLKDTKPTVLVRQLKLYLNTKDAICCGGRIHNAPVCEKYEISLFVT